MSGNKINEDRIGLENELKVAEDELKKATNNVDRIKRLLWINKENCPHKNIIEGKAWQGGQRYYIPTECLDCGKKGDRYSPEFTREENRKWYKNYANAPTEEDYKNWDEIEKNKIIDNRCW